MPRSAGACPPNPTRRDIPHILLAYLRLAKGTTRYSTVPYQRGARVSYGTSTRTCTRYDAKTSVASCTFRLEFEYLSWSWSRNAGAGGGGVGSSGRVREHHVLVRTVFPVLWNAGTTKSVPVPRNARARLKDPEQQPMGGPPTRAARLLVHYAATGSHDAGAYADTDTRQSFSCWFGAKKWWRCILPAALAAT